MSTNRLHWFRLLVATAVAFALTSLSQTAHAYRPFDGTDADVAPPGEFELELGPAQYYRQGRSNFLIAPATVLNLGIAPRLELVSDFRDFVALDGDQQGAHRFRLRDSDLLAKLVLRRGNLQGCSGPSVAIEAGMLLPETGNAGLGMQADTIVSFAGKNTALHLNQSLADNRDHRFETFSSAIIEVGRAHEVHPVAEVFFDHVFGGGSEYSALAGALWTYSESLTLDMGLRRSHVEGMAAWEVRLGLTWTTPLWKPGA